MSHVSGGEIVTLQFGPYANFCGTHLWNLLDESLHRHSNDEQSENTEMYFRASTSGPTKKYTPRLLCYDMKDNLGSLSKFGTLQRSEAPAPASSSSSVRRIERDAPKKHSFVEALETHQTETTPPPSEQSSKTTEPQVQRFNFDSTVRYWSDFLNVDLNSKTVHDVSCVREWSADTDRFEIGRFALKTSEQKEEALDAIRFYTEECGLFRGFQTLVDMTSPAFSAFAAEYLTELRDEYPKKDVLLFSLKNSSATSSSLSANTLYQKEALERRLAGEALSLSALLEQADLFLPLSVTSTQHLPHLRVNVNKVYHSSAVLAAAIEALTSPLRFSDFSVSLSSLCHSLHRGSKRNLVSAMLSMPLPPLSQLFSASTRSFQELRRDALQPLNPYYSRPEDYRYGIYSQLAVLQGVDEALWKSKGLFVKATGAVQSLAEWFAELASTAGSSKTFALNRPVDLPITYPPFFNREVRENGLIAPGEVTEVYSVPLLATAENSNEVHRGLSRLVKSFTSLDRQKVFLHQAPDMNADEYTETVNNLLDIVDRYE